MTVVVNEASCVQLTCVTLNSIRINPIDWCQFYRYWRTCPCLSARTRIIHNSFTKWRLNSATQLMRWWTACDCRRHSQSQLMSWRQLFSIRRAQKLTVNHNCRMSHEFDACGVRRKGRGANWRSENAFIDAQTTSRTEISLHWTSQMSRAEAIANGVYAKIKAAIWCRPFFGGIGCAPNEYQFDFGTTAMNANQHLFRHSFVRGPFGGMFSRVSALKLSARSYPSVICQHECHNFQFVSPSFGSELIRQKSRCESASDSIYRPARREYTVKVPENSFICY